MTKDRDTLIKDLIPLATSVAIRQSRAHLRDDSVSVALVALVEAVDSYQARDGASLATYVSVSVSRAVQDYCIFRDRTIPRSGNQLTRSVERDHTEEFTDYTEVHLSCDGAEKAYETDTDNKTIVDNLLKCLTDRERLVINMRYHEDAQLSTIADVLGVSTQRASEIERRALVKMRSAPL